MWTHYWERPTIIEPVTFKAIGTDTRWFLEILGTEIAGPLGHGVPLVDGEHIRFNAPYPGGHDTFVFDRVAREGLDVRRTVWDHCTTVESYDLAVRCVLLIARRHLGTDLFIHDLGRHRKAWDQAWHHLAVCEALREIERRYPRRRPRKSEEPLEDPPGGQGLELRP